MSIEFLKLWFDATVKPMLGSVSKIVPVQTIGAYFIAYGITVMRRDKASTADIMAVVDVALAEEVQN